MDCAGGITMTYLERRPALPRILRFFTCLEYSIPCFSMTTLIQRPFFWEFPRQILPAGLPGPWHHPSEQNRSMTTCTCSSDTLFWFLPGPYGFDVGSRNHVEGVCEHLLFWSHLCFKSKTIHSLLWRVSIRLNVNQWIPSNLSPSCL